MRSANKLSPAQTIQARASRAVASSENAGSDERQYCSPGFNLPVGQLARTLHGRYDGYHNSLDDKNFMSISSLVHSVNDVEALLKKVELAGHFRNLSPYGEPQLGRRGLYPNLSSTLTLTQSNDAVIDGRTFLNRALTVLNYSDGEHSLLDIAAGMNLDVEDLQIVVDKLEEAELLKFEPKVKRP
jgi:aminopeptidase-like protein